MNLHGDWKTAPLVALDLEGSGAQDRDNEAILEIAVVPVTAGQPDTAAAYSTLINPGRRIPRRPWISPGLTAAVLDAAPAPADVGPEPGSTSRAAQGPCGRADIEPPPWPTRRCRRPPTFPPHRSARPRRCR